jgi:hypothetical protein
MYSFDNAHFIFTCSSHVYSDMLLLQQQNSSVLHRLVWHDIMMARLAIREKGAGGG